MWLRAEAVVLGLFALGHTLGTVVRPPHPTGDLATVLGVMQRYRFPVMGMERSYWQFYHGFALIISLLLGAFAVIAWQTGDLARREPRRALPLALTLEVGAFGLLALSVRYFFTGPIVASALALAVQTVAVVRLRRAAAR
jgi:hypothetical protein